MRIVLRAACADLPRTVTGKPMVAVVRHTRQRAFSNQRFPMAALPSFLFRETIPDRSQRAHGAGDSASGRCSCHKRLSAERRR